MNGLEILSQTQLRDQMPQMFPKLSVSESLWSLKVWECLIDWGI